MRRVTKGRIANPSNVVVAVQGGRGVVLHAALVSAVARFARPFSYRGVVRSTWYLRRLFHPADSVVVRLPSGVVYRVYLDDGYWAALLDPRFRYEPEVETLLRAALSPRSYFVDAGANGGYWSLFAARRGVQRVIAVEPAPESFTRLLDNVALSGAPVECLRAAVWRDDGDEVAFRTDHLWHPAACVAAVSGAGSVAADAGAADPHRFETVRVPTVSIDALVSRQCPDATAPLVVKLDIEGAEGPALAGARRTLAERDVLLVYEDHARDPASELSRALAEQGYLLYAADGDAGPRRVDVSDICASKVDAHRGYNFAACRPESSFPALLASAARVPAWA